MLTTKIRTTLIVAVVSVGLLASVGSARGLTVKGSTTEIMAHINKPNEDLDLRFRSSAVSVVSVIDGAELVSHATAGGTGDGSTDEACASRARLINSRAYEIIAILIGLRSGHGDWQSAKAATRGMVDEIEAAVGDGCSIGYEEGPPPEDDPVLL